MKENEIAKNKAYWDADKAANQAEFDDIARNSSERHQQQMAEQDRLQAQEIAAVRGSDAFRQGQGGDESPEGQQQETALQEQIAESRRDYERQTFARTGLNIERPSGQDRMAMWGRMAANGGGQAGNMQKIQADRIGEDTQANARKYAESYPDRTKETGRKLANGEKEIALTGKGVSSEEADRRRSEVDARRKAMGKGREARGGMSERQRRDISRRAKNPEALRAYAMRNGLENHPMVQSAMSGGRKDGRAGEFGESFNEPLKTQYSKAEESKGGADAEEFANNSEAMKHLGITGTSDFYADSKALYGEMDDMDPADLQEWAGLFQKKHKGDKGGYRNDPHGAQPGRSALHSATKSLAEAINSGKEKDIAAAKEAYRKAYDEYNKKSKDRADSFQADADLYSN